MRKQTLTAAGLVALSFGITLAVLWVQREPSAPRGLAGRAALPRLWSSAVSPGPGPQAVSAAARPAPPSGQRPAAPPSSSEVPPFDVSGPPLPMMLAISSHPGRAEGDGDEDAVASNRVGVSRQVDLVSDSGEPLEITVLATDVPTQETTQARLLVPPHGQAHVGEESGLKLQPGYQVALRSRGYQELIQTVR